MKDENIVNLFIIVPIVLFLLFVLVCTWKFSPYSMEPRITNIEKQIKDLSSAVMELHKEDLYIKSITQ